MKNYFCKNHVFIDTNVIVGAFKSIGADRNCLKYLLEKDKFLYISSLTVAQFVSIFQPITINGRRKFSDASIRKHIKTYLMAKFNIINFTEQDIEKSLEITEGDMEDIIQLVLGNKVKCFYFITNNIKDYRKFNNIVAVTPSQVRNINWKS